MSTDWSQHTFNVPESYWLSLGFPDQTNHLLCDPREIRWSVSEITSDRIAVRCCSAASGHIIYGESSPNHWTTYVPIGGSGMRANGRLVDQDRAFVVPPSAQICITFRKPHEWCVLQLSTDALCESVVREIAWRESCAVVLNPKLEADVRELYRLAIDAKSPAPSLEKIEHLATAVVQCPKCSRDRVGRKREPRIELLLLVADAIRKADSMKPTIKQLEDLSGVSERTIRNVFHECVAMSPQEFTLLTRLHECRQRFRQPTDKPLVIKEIAASLAFTDFGRFAGYYQSAFLELPSKKIRRMRFGLPR